MHRICFSRPLLFVFAIVLFGTPADAQDAAATRWYTKQTNWRGFDQFHFQIADSSAYLVVPKEPLAGKPWIWRARFPGYHDEMDIQLVGQGFHLAYLNVAEEFGCPEVIQRAGKFYSFLVNRRGLNRQASLEGVSRGGLFVYNYAAKHPAQVASIYCDTPVCDFRSWPGGKGKGIGSAAAWKQCLAAYGISESEALKYDKMPIDQAAILAKAKIPILHIVAENDRVVPPQENSYRLQKRLQQAGHDMQIISVAEGTEKSSGHHFDHPDPQRVIDFFLSHVPAVGSP